MKLVRTILVAAALAGLPALALAQSNAPAGNAAGGAAAGSVFAGPAGAFAGGMFGGAAGAAADVAAAPLSEGRSVYVPPYPASLAPGYIAPGPVYLMPDEGPLQRTCRTNVYGERQCESFR
jgi:hypothetical protein